jgi:putative membrane protein insertion efficiency factor
MKIVLWLVLLPRNILISPVVLWRTIISPTYGNVCRYYPSCSTYGLQTLQRRGVVMGVPLTVWRILRCNPWSSGGVDEVKTGPDWITVGRLGFVIPIVQRKQG